MAAANTWSPSTPRIQLPKIDAADRRQIEARNEEKSHTTKQELDDIKLTHYKEKFFAVRITFLSEFVLQFLFL